MGWCHTCQEEVEVVEDEANGFSCCSLCGRVVEEIAFASDLQFAKGADGDGQMVGQMVGEGGQHRGLARYSGGKVWAGGADSHEAAVARGRAELASLVAALHVTPAGEALEASHRLYKLALQRGFTRGRRISQVAATCLYIYARQEKRPYMLIDFSDHLCVNIYTLGSVYLQLLRLFRLDDTASFTRPVDPSLYLHRFVDRLKLGDKAQAVSATALKLVQSMKRDWMQTGRRPSGICGAALFIAAHIHGCERSKKDIISVVHVGWHTIEKRVVEFAHSQAGDMTLDEFEAHAGLLEQDRQRVLLEYEQRLALPAPSPASGGGGKDAATECQPDGQIVDAQEARMARLKQQEKMGACEHVDAGVPMFAHGMCRACFEEFLVVAGMEQGADPPAYTKGIIKQIRNQVLALPASNSTPQLPGTDEQLLLEGARHGSSNDLAGGEDIEAAPELRELAPELQELDEVLGREELGKLTRAMGGAQSTQSGAGQAVKASGRGEQGTQPAGVEAAGTGGAVGSSGAAVLGAEAGGEGGPHEGQTTLPAHVAHVAGVAAGRHVVAAAVPEPHTAQRAAMEQQLPHQVQGAGASSAQQDAAAKRSRGVADGDDALDVSDGTGAAAREGGVKKQKTGTLAAGSSMLDAFFGGDSGGDAAEYADEQPQHGSPEASKQEANRDGEQGGSGKELAVVVGQEDQALLGQAAEDEETDHLEDVDDDEVNVYIASAEEAEVKTMLWTEMNKDWLEKQEAKKALLKRQEELGITKPKRAGKRAPKALPPAETAEGAAKSMLESKKLSNKINYNALKDLFNDAQPDVDRADSVQPQPSMSVAHSAPQLSESAISVGNGNSLHMEDVGGFRLGAGEEVASVSAALKQRAAARARDKAQDASKYQLALQREKGRRGSSSSLGGGFLGSLTFVAGGKGAEARQRPQSLGSLKPRSK